MLFVPEDHVEFYINRQLNLAEISDHEQGKIDTIAHDRRELLRNIHIVDELFGIFDSIDEARMSTTLQGYSARPLDTAILPDSLVLPTATAQQAIRSLNTVLNYYDGFILHSALYNMKIFDPEQNDFIHVNVIHPDVFAYMDKLAKLHNDFFEDVRPYYE